MTIRVIEFEICVTNLILLGITIVLCDIGKIIKKYLATGSEVKSKDEQERT